MSAIRWLVEAAIDEVIEESRKALGITDEARLYNAETMAAAAREAISQPIQMGDPDPYEPHVWGVNKAVGGARFYPIGAGPAAGFWQTGFAYSAMSQVLGEVAEWGQRAVIYQRINELRNALDPMLSSGFEVADAQVRAGDIGDVSILRSDIRRLYDGFLANWQQGIISGDGASFSSYMEQMVGAGSIFSAYKNQMYQASVIPRMRRYWLTTYTPSIPDERMAWILWRRGIIKEADFNTYASYEGWSPKNAELLKESMRSYPNERFAFRLMMRGSISYNEYKRYIVANGWDEWWHSHLYELFEWLPNARDAFTLHRRGHIDQNNMYKLFRAQGFRPAYDEVLPKLWERIPLPSDAFKMFMRGAITEADFDHYIEANEWEDGSAVRLWAIYQNLPSSREAFTLFKRGKIDATVLKALYQADGYMPTYQNIISGMFERIPHPRDAFNAFMRGVIDRKKFDYWVEANEWQSGMSDFLYDIYTRIPSYREAFYMWAKGLITVTKRDQLYSANGFDKEWHQLLTDNNYYVPTVYDLTRIADYVEIDRIWAIKILKERGLRDNDITKIVAMLKIRPLRDEIRRQITLWVKRYRLGWATPTQLEEALQEYLEGGYIQDTEKTLITEEAELNYEDELMEEKIDIYSWYFKTRVISEEDLLEDFLDLGIREEKANLMVELLKAQGYYGYY